MIQHLTIKNYALIDELELDLSGGMTIITGETGAGKSILLGALSLLLGSRADLSALYSKDLKCVIEGTFNTADYELGAFFGEHDIDIDPVTIIRREIGKDGKSRAFINDTPVNLSVLKELGSRLIEIHSQHETLTLNNSGFQMMVLDSCAGSAGHLEAYRKVYKDYNHSLELLGQLKERESKAASEQDYLQFQFDELESAQLKQGEKEAMEKELELLNNSESISLSLSRASEIINGDQDNILRAVSSVVTSLQPVATFHTGVEDILKRLRSLQIELKDIASELDVVAGSVSYDPVRAEIVSDRLDLIYRLEQKHRLQTVEELIALKDSISEKLLSFSSLGDEIEKTEKLCSRLLSELEKHAGKLSANRHKAVEGIEQQVQKTLSNLGMKHAVLKIDLQSLPKGQFRDSGTDTVEFLFSANKGIEYRELSKVASGGELSRLMLSIKSILASLRGLPTIIFDEIDTGVSGDVALKIGKLLREMSLHGQCMAISHLPQVAASAAHHFLVQKSVVAERMQTRVAQLSAEARIEEIARLLSGEAVTPAAIANANALLKGA